MVLVSIKHLMKSTFIYQFTDTRNRHGWKVQ